jgi:PAS domain S-box-containing protein
MDNLSQTPVRDSALDQNQFTPLRRQSIVVLVLRFIIIASLIALTVIISHYQLSDIHFIIYLALIIFLLNTVFEYINYFHLFNRKLGSIIGLIIDLLAMILFIYFSGGSDAQHFDIVFLIIILITATTHSVISAFIITLIGAVIYGLIAISGSTAILDVIFSSQFLSRISFLFVVATFVGYLSEEVERQRTEKIFTENKLTTELKNLTQYLHDVFQSVTSGMIVVDTNEKITVFNKRAEEILGVPAQNVLGRPISEIYPLKGFTKILIDFYNQPTALREDTSPLMRTEITLDRGLGNAPLAIGLRFSNLYNVSGKRIGVIGVFQDLTQIKQHEQETLKKEQIIKPDQVTNIIFRDFFKILNNLRSSIEAAIANPEMTPVSKTLALTKHDIDKSLVIANNLLIFSSKPQPQKTVILLSNIINEALASIKYDLENIEIIKKIDITPPLMSDPNLLKQAVLNLFINAQQAIFPNKGTITIEVKNQLDFIEVIISDSSRVIKPEEQAQLFNPLFNMPDREGSGLGLYVSREIINTLKGQIEVQSMPDHGTIFIIRLPPEIR